MDAKKIKDNGWRQGSLVLPEDVPALVENSGVELPAEARLLVITQSCDLVHHDFDNEPYAELGILRPADAEDGRKRHSKNPRFLQLFVNVDGADVLFEFHAASKVIVPREQLESIYPDASSSLDQANLSTVRTWLANRYRRVALPDSFNTETSHIWGNKAVKRDLTKASLDIKGVYINLSPFRELEDGETYKVHLLAITDPDADSDSDKREKAQAALDALATRLRACDRIDSVVADLKSASDVSVAYRDMHVRLDFDDLSLRGNPQGEVAD